MTWEEFKPFHNRLVKFTGKSGVTGVGTFLDLLHPGEKLFPEDVIFILQENFDSFKKMIDGVDRRSSTFESAIKTFGKRVDLNTFVKMELERDQKYEMIARWKHILTTNKKFIAYIKLEDIEFKDHFRSIPAEYGGLRINSEMGTKGEPVHRITDLKTLLWEPLTSSEFTELFDLYEKQRLF